MYGLLIGRGFMLDFSGPPADRDAPVTHDEFETVLRKLDAYSSAGALQRHSAGKRGSLGIAVTRGLWAFVRTYFLRRGFLDGRTGFMIAVFNAQTVYYRFLKLARLNDTR